MGVEREDKGRLSEEDSEKEKREIRERRTYREEERDVEGEKQEFREGGRRYSNA